MTQIVSGVEPVSMSMEFVKTCAGGSMSVDSATLNTGQNLLAGTVLGRITATGLLTILAPAATDGSQTAVAILGYDTNATAANRPCTVIARLAEVTDTLLTFPVGITAAQRVTALANLATVFIIAR